MTHRTRSLLRVGLLPGFCCASALAGAARELRIEYLGSRDGLTHQAVIDVVQDHQGYPLHDPVMPEPLDLANEPRCVVF